MTKTSLRRLPNSLPVTTLTMFRFICKTLVVEQRIVDFKIHYVNVRYFQTLQSLNSISQPTDQQSLTLSYLTNECGLSVEKAISASKLVDIKTTEKPNSVLQFLRSHGFSNSHISTLVSKSPSIIFANTENNLKPKIEFLKSVGFLEPDLSEILCSNPLILKSNLKNHIVPTFDFLRSFVQTNENIINTLKRSTRVFGYNVEKRMMPNINTLRAHGVPEPHIVKLIILQPQSLLLKADLFENVVNAIKEMGFETKNRSFIMGVISMSVLSKATWESKKEILMSYGWSESDFCLAFKRQSILMLCSVEKIRKLMDFLVKRIGLKSSDIVRCPNLLLASLERRIIPRWSVLTVVMSKKLSKKDINVVRALSMTKKNFEKKFVTCYMDDNPEVMKAYESGLHSLGSINGL